MLRRLIIGLLTATVGLAPLGAGHAPLLAAPAAMPDAPFAPTLLWQTCPNPPGYCETGWYASPAVADLNHDGHPDVLWGGYTLMALKGSSGGLEWEGQHPSERLWPS